MAAHNSRPKVIVITGGSSGIGQALAEYYAAPGVVLGLSGQNEQRLSAVARLCEAKGAIVDARVLDVRDRGAMARWIEGFDDAHPIDLVIANAGISGGTGEMFSGESPEQVRQIFDVNLNGVLNTILPVQGRMIVRKRGQIAIISSLAGYRGWPGAPAYCGSKAAVKVYGEGLRGALRGSNIAVNVICPGFVTTRMTADNSFCMPFLIDESRAAKIIARGLARNKGRISFPLMPAFLAWCVMALPDGIAQQILRLSPAKRPVD